MTTKSIRFALATAGVVAAVGAVAAAGAASQPTSAPGSYAVSQCADGKWATYTNPDGSQKFKNQGQCVAFFVHASK